MARATPEQQPPPLSRYWNGYVVDCSASIARFHRITTALPSGPARTWLADIGRKLESQLDAVRRLATVGDSIEPAWFWVSEEPAKRISLRLDAARTSFQDAVAQAAEIAEQATLDPSHSDVQAHLEVLAKQAGELAPAPVEPEPERRGWRRRRDQA